MPTRVPTPTRGVPTRGSGTARAGRTARRASSRVSSAVSTAPRFETPAAFCRVVVAAATPGVTHLHWFDATRGTCVGRATRVDASRRGLARRAPIRPSRGRRVVFRTSSGTPPRDATRPEHRRIPGPAASRRLRRVPGRLYRGSRARVWVRGSRARVRFGNRAGASRAKPTAVPPAAAIFTAAFRTLDRERGENHGVEGAMRRAWTSVFGARD